MKYRLFNQLLSVVLSLSIVFFQGLLYLLTPSIAHAAITGTFNTTEVVANVSSSTIPAITFSGGANVVNGTVPNVTLAGGVNEVKATRTLTVGALPAASETITIGACVVTFSDAGDDVDELNCNDNVAGISRTTAVATNRTAGQIAVALQSLTNVSDAGHGALTVGAPTGTTISFTTTGTEASATDISFTDNTTGDITSTANTTGVIPVASTVTVTIVDALAASAADQSVTIDGVVIALGNTASTVNQVAATIRSGITSDGGYAGKDYTVSGSNADITFTRKVAGTAGDGAITLQDSSYTKTNAIAATTTIAIPAGLVVSAADQSVTIDGVVITLGAASQTAAQIAATIDAADFSSKDYDVISSGDNVTFTKNATGPGGNVSLTIQDSAYGAKAQVVDFTPANVTAGETFRATVNGTAYTYLAASGNTVQTVVEALQPLIDANGAVTCTEDDSKVRCTADTAGTAFTYLGEVVDVTAPASFTAGTVVTTGGTVVSGKWNSTNTGVDITIPVSNDPTLTGGTIQLQAEADGSFVSLGAAYTILQANLGNNVTLSRTDSNLEGITGFSEGDNITFRAVITDSNANATTGNISANSLDVDQAVPTISSITTKDTSGDGRVETATLVFSESITDSSFSAGNFTIAGSSGTSISTGTGDDNTFDVIVSGGVSGTDAKDVTYTQGSGRDLSGNPLANVVTGTVTETDGASPVLMSARTNTTTTIDLTFSEDLLGTTVSAADFGVTSYTVSTASEVSAGLVRVTTSSAFGTGDRPVVSYNTTASNGVKDLNDNTAPAVTSITPTDGVAPVLSSVNLASDNSLLSVLFAKTGANVILTFTSSETINSPTVAFTSGGNTVAGTPTINNTGNNWTAFYVANSADTEGSVAYTINYSDTSANSGAAVTSGSGSVTFDKTNPTAPGTPSTTTPVNTTSNQTWTWTAGSDALSGVYQYVWSVVNNATSQTVSNGTTTSSTLQLVTNLAQGVWNLLVQTQDSAGNLSTTSTGQLTVDTTNPTISADNASSNWQTVNPNIILTVSDSGGAGLSASKVRYNWDATANATTGTVFTNGTQISIPSEGTHTLNLYAEDAAGNSNTFNGTYKLDTVSPTSSITAPGNNLVTNSNPTFTADASDATSGIASVKFQYKTNAAGSYTDLNTDSSAPYAADWVSVTLVNGTTYNLRALATDAAGNTTNSSVVNIIFDTTNPVTTADTGASNSSLVTTKNTALNITDSVLLANDTDANTITVTGVSSPANGTVSRTGGVTTFTPTNNFVGNGTFTYTVTDGANTASGSVTVKVNPPVSTGQTVLEPSTTLSTNSPQAVVGGTSDPVTLTIPSSVTNPSLDVTSLTTTSGSNKSATIAAPITVNASTAIGSVTMEIPSGIVITGSNSDWNGTINVPQVQSNSSVSLGGNLNTNAVIEVGFGDVPLTLSKAVRLVLPGQARRMTGYVRSGIFTSIDNTCSADTQAAGDALAAGGDCKIDVGNDLVIWTKHFTKFVSFTDTSTTSSGPQACFDGKPGSAPKLTSAVAGTNSVTLTWDEASDPVSYYLITYGASSGAQTYGNANIGGKGTRSFTVEGLSGGTTYYFKIRAGNGCMPGDYSNEISATPGGGVVDGPASGFQAGVLGARTERTGGSEQGTVNGESTEGSSDNKDGSVLEDFNPTPRSGGILSSIGSFFSGIFRFIGQLFGR